jgi:hypothetical protein
MSFKYPYKNAINFAKYKIRIGWNFINHAEQGWTMLLNFDRKVFIILLLIFIPINQFKAISWVQ